MSDHDELGDFLRSEVPEPKADYWDGIDAMLHRVEQEQAEAAGGASDNAATTSTGHHLRSVTPLSEEIIDETQTDDGLIRLTDMANPANPTRISDRRRHLPLLVAAALIAVVGLGSFFALAQDQDPTTINAANEDGSADGDSVADGDSSAGDGEGAVDGEGAIDELSTVEGLSAGSVWSYSVDDLPRPLLSLGDNAEPFDGQIWIKPLVATGASGDHVDQIWLEFEGLGEPNVWLPLSTIEQTAEGLPPIAPAELVAVGEISSRLLPDLDIEPNETIPSGAALSSTGLRSQSDGATWLLISAEFPFFVLEEQTMPASEANTSQVSVGRRCYSDGTVTLTMDIAQDGSFSGWQVPVGMAGNTDGFAGDQLHLAPNGDLLLTLAGLSLNDGDTSSYRVSESSVAALGNGFVTISTSTWTITDAMVTQPGAGDEIRYPSVDCTTSAADLILIESTVRYYPPDTPFEPVTIAELRTTPAANRVCYRQNEGEPVYVFDFTDDGGLANGLRSGALETISATKTVDSDTTYNVARLILGDQENGRDTITTNLWEISPERINLPFDGEEVPAVDCSIVADEVAQVEDFLQSALYPAYPLGS